MGGARAGQPDHDERAGDRDLEDLGVPVQEVADQEPVGGVADAVAEHQETAEAGPVLVGVHLASCSPSRSVKSSGPKSSSPVRAVAAAQTASTLRSWSPSTRRTRGPSAGRR